jgi:hypothetical protein
LLKYVLFLLHNLWTHISKKKNFTT